MHAAIVVCYGMVGCYSEHSHNNVSIQRDAGEVLSNN